jgi:hypothetical protein
MRRIMTLMAVTVCTGLCAARADDALEAIPAERVAAIAPRLVEAADKINDPPFKVNADADKATGLHKPQVGGLMVVPTKALKAESLTGVQESLGAPVGYLFLYKLSPVVDGKPLDSAKLPMMNVKDDNGTERDISALRLAVKKESDTEWKLLVFAKDKKPILSAQLKEQANGSDLPISVAGKETGNDQGTLTITMFGKYAADVTLGRLQ